MSLRMALAGVMALGCATASPAAAKKRAPPPPPAPVGTPVQAVSLENKRLVALQSFEIAIPGKDKDPATLVGKLDKPLKGGESASVPLTGAKGCVFELKWAFEDVQDSGAVDLCSDAHIVLID